MTILPATDPFTAWSLFENGAIVTDGKATAIARTVEVSREKLRCLVRQEFDRVLHESPDNVGLHAPSETTMVTGGFPRAITFVIHGFRDNGLASDTDFDITVALRFGLVWEQQTFTEPEMKSLAASLVLRQSQPTASAQEISLVRCAMESATHSLHRAPSDRRFPREGTSPLARPT